MRKSNNFLDKIYHVNEEINYLLQKSNNLLYRDFIEDETLKRAFSRSIEIIGDKLIPNKINNKYKNIE